ncbi:MAG: lipoate--protein ligase family protein, partial [Chloroflexi bacterium]|nr:lipoate--protein ligase family protein [Chloroflexota bacterium]
VGSYRVLSFGLLNGLKRLGVEARQATKEDVRAVSRAGKGGPVCFDTPSHYEITWQGKKLIGSAQLRRKQIVLQHGTLPLCGDLNRILKVLNFSDADRKQQQQLLPQRATTLEQVLGKGLSFDVVSEALIRGFAEALNLSFEEMPLTDQEQKMADKLRVDQYANNKWKKRV